MKHQTRICAHRGVTNGYQENSVDAIKAAQEMGLEMVEFDVQRSADDVWFLLHDQFLGNEENLVKHLEFDEIRTQAEAEGIHIDTLDDLLDQVTEIPMNIECKSESYGDGVALARYLDQKSIPQPFNVSSFSRDTIYGLYDINPNLKLSYLGYIMPFWRWRLLHRKIPLHSINPWVLFLYTWKIRWAHRNNIEVHTWTVNQPNRIKKCLDLGVDVIITDNPDTALDIRHNYTGN